MIGSKKIYLDNAATTLPKLPEIKEVMKNYFEDYNISPNRTSGGNTLLDSVRKKILDYFEATDEYNVAFVPTATIGMNIVIKSLTSDKNSQIITTNCEHHSVYRPLSELKVPYKIIEYMDANQEEHPDRILNAINNNTKGIIMNHGSNVTGDIYDVETIGKKLENKKITFVVDISQTAGVYDISLKKINADIVVGSAHKHLYSLPGIGYIIYKKDILLEPIYYGGTGKLSSSMMQPKVLPDMLEVGTMNLPSLLALSTSLDVMTQEKRKEYRKYESELVKYFKEKAKSIKGIKIFCGKENKRTGVISFKIEGFDSNYVIAPYLLKEGNILVRAGLHCAPEIHKTLRTFPEGTVRISFSHNNNKEEIDKLVELLKNLTE